MAKADGGMLAAQASLQELVLEFLAADPSPELVVPGPRALWVANLPQCGILYDLDEQPGRLLWMDVIAPVLDRPGIVPLVRSLGALVDIYLALAEAGHISVDMEHWPCLTGPDDEIRDIYLQHASL